MIKLLKKNYLEIIFLVSILLPLLMAIISLYTKTMPFWFDPARDFLAGLGNQHKVTLIGQPTGIPGLFYGPYWIWLISMALFVSKDPRIVQFLVLTLPYFIIFPLILYRLKDVFDLKISIILWTLFIFGFLRYTIFPWNPHLAPLLVLVAFYLLITASRKQLHYFYLKTFMAGIVVGFIGNFHISFDIGLALGIIIFFFSELIFSRTKASLKEFILRVGIFIFGFILTFIPFLAFEARHGFSQIKTVLLTLSSPYAVVGLKGMTKPEIIHRFFQVFQELFNVPWTIALLITLGAFAYFSLLIVMRKISLTSVEQKVLALSISVISAIMFVYLTSKNPVWEYHFIAMEVIFLMLIGLLMKKIKFIKVIALIWAIVVVLIGVRGYFLVPKPSVLSYDTLGKKEYIVDLIKSDSKNGQYTVFAYNPGIYSYDYSYLFDWMAGKQVPYDPGQIPAGGERIYLIIQKADPAIVQDYINFHAPSSRYKTIRTWKIPDGTIVISRESLKR